MKEDFPRGQGRGYGNYKAAKELILEAYAVAYDAVSKRIVVAAQDNGVAYQSAPGSPLYNAIGGADGLNAAVNDRTLGNRSAVYTSIQSSLAKCGITLTGKSQTGATYFTSLGDAPLRAILQACYDLHGEGSPPTFDRVTSRLDDPALRHRPGRKLLVVHRLRARHV